MCEHFVKAFYLRAFHNLIFFGFFLILAFYTIFTPFSSDHGIQFSHFLKDAFFSAKVIVDIHRHIDMSMSHNIVLLLSCHQKTALIASGSGTNLQTLDLVQLLLTFPIIIPTIFFRLCFQLFNDSYHCHEKFPYILLFFLNRSFFSVSFFI